MRSSPQTYSGQGLSAVPAARALSLSEQIANHIASMILHGELLSGERIREQLIADLFKVSRAPIREALRILEKDGVVVIEPRRGASVTNLSKKEVVDILGIRRVLFGLAARLCAEIKDKALVTSLKLRVEELDRLVAAGGDADRHTRITGGMTLSILEGSKNTSIVDIYTRLSFQIARYRRLAMADPLLWAPSAKNWRKLAGAIDAGNADRAEEIAQLIINVTIIAASSKLEG